MGLAVEVGLRWRIFGSQGGTWNGGGGARRGFDRPICVLVGDAVRGLLGSRGQGCQIERRSNLRLRRTGNVCASALQAIDLCCMQPPPPSLAVDFVVLKNHDQHSLPGSAKSVVPPPLQGILLLNLKVS